MKARMLLILCLAYATASLAHFVHNAEFLADYPNMPDWLSREMVYVVWLGQTAIGVAGGLLVHYGYRLVGLAAIAIYAALGFDSLSHYLFAPFAAHTGMMHFTIWLEAAAAALLLVAAAFLAAKRMRAGQRGNG